VKKIQPYTGTVTFLFTDIEESTKLWQLHPEAMSTALSRHHALLKESITVHNGYIFQIVGDAFCAAFSTVSEGLQAALRAQRALAAETWGETGAIRVRMALHTGNAQVRPREYTSGEYVSNLTLSRTARLLSAGHGGQILLSLPAMELVSDQLPVGTELRDLGIYRLKDLIRPEHIFQVVAPDLPCEFPPLKTLDAHPNNLPSQLTSFIGREVEQERVRQLLTQNRLVTLTGFGGTGKTRLSLQVGADLIENFEHGVWFVELASLMDGSHVPQRLASALEIQEEPGSPLLDLLVRFVKNRKLLVILDNCEHLGEACAQLAVQLIQAAPHLKILATSRESLHILGEIAFPVPPLSTPDPRQVISLEKLNQFEAVRVFIERAAAAQPAFQLTDHNAPAIADICFRLDGIPLAIELAAARVRSLPVEKIAERIVDRFRILTGGDRTALAHHQTMRLCINWSYDLLSEPERAVFRRLSVFAGGWTLEAAEAVCVGAGLNEPEVLDLLGNLVEKSLVGLGTETDRYGMLETIRQFAAEKLVFDREADATNRAHFQYFLQFAEKAEPELTGPRHAIWIQRMEDEFDNLRAAIRWALDSGRGDEALHLCYVIGRYWYIGDLSEGRLWLEQALAFRESSNQIAQAEGLFRAGELAYRMGDLGLALPYLEESLVIARALGYDRLVASALLYLASVIGYKGDTAREEDLLEESLAVFQKLGDQRWVSVALLVLGTHSSDNKGDYLQAKQYYEQSLALSQEAGENWVMTASLHNLGWLNYIQGDIEAAQPLFEKAVNNMRQLRSKLDIANGLGNLGLIAIQKHEAERARELQTESLAIRQELGLLFDMLISFSGFASVLRLEGQAITAARLQGFVTARLKQLERKIDFMEQADFERTAADLTATLGEAGYRQAFEAGKLLTLEQALELVKQ
jgi:predicted ATPase/class 3 adenylate cyclase